MRQWLPLLLIVALIAAVGGVIANVSPAVSQESVAWTQALDLVKASPQERALWSQPKVLYIDQNAYWEVDPHRCGSIPKGALCATRLCGRNMMFLTDGFSGSDKIMTDTFVVMFMHPSESKYLPLLLVHEFLHHIWVYKTLDKEFAKANPDSEAWVQSLVDAPCPNLF